MDSDKIIAQMSLEELCGQVLCYDIYDHDDPIKVEEILKKIKPGSIFVSKMSSAKIEKYLEIANKYSKIPVIVAADIENGPGCAIMNEDLMPDPMAWGATDEEALIERAGEQTGELCRLNNIHWSFSPVVDINLNFNNPVVNIRAVSDCAQHVVKIAGAYSRGLQKNNNMVAGCKHFPGDGLDDRNQHFCTTINNMSREEWFKTYGYVYKKMIEQGTGSIMVAHIACPAFEDGDGEESSLIPAVLSYNIMTKLLKEEMGFKGCIVSDAMSMLGVAGLYPLNEIAVKFLNAGGDVVLFPEPDDYDNILYAVKNGTLSVERLKDAVRRVLELKNKTSVIDNMKSKADIGRLRQEFSLTIEKIAEKSIKIIRDCDNILPLTLQKGDKILLVNIIEPYFNKPPEGNEFATLVEELEKREYVVDALVNPKHRHLKDIMDDYSVILINSMLSSRNYHGGSLRMGWNSIRPLWRGYVLEHERVIFTSFGDPYKLYELPFLKTYINTFSSSESSQRAFVKIITGEIQPKSKNPVRLQGFFEREV